MSGALTFALGAGCAAVSTPYWYASDMLDSGAGKLFAFGDSAALSKAVCEFIDEPKKLTAARKEAARIGATFTWPSIGMATAEVLR